MSPLTPRQPLKPLDEALVELLAHAAPSEKTETVSTFDADGRVLAEDLVAALDVPAHDNSSMDGYAVRSADWRNAQTVLHVNQRIAAGSNGSVLAAMSAARIFTGAPIPDGADAVVMQEDCTTPGPEQVCVATQPQVGQWIRRRGEDVTSGRTVLPKGELLAPESIGLAASVGYAALRVVAPVRVALFSTGDELVMPGDVAPQDMLPGAIYNSNRFFLRALLQRLGCTVTDMGIVPDKLAATKEALLTASSAHDLVLTSGGVSVGEEDHIKPAVQALGKLNLWQIAIKPGKPFAHGRSGACHFIGLPGNPVSSFVTFLVLVRPFLQRLQGLNQSALPVTLMRADFDWLRPDKRQEFLRVRRNAKGGLDLFPNQSSGVLSSVVWGDGLVDNPAGQSIRLGDQVGFVAFNDLLG
jgi:molybdopterin molybdotransferase